MNIVCIRCGNHYSPEIRFCTACGAFSGQSTRQSNKSPSAYKSSVRPHTTSPFKFDKPLIYVTIDTTGFNPTNDRIVYLEMIKISTDGTREIKWEWFNPGVPISPDATDFHGLIDEDVADIKLGFDQYARTIRAFFGDCDIGGEHANLFLVPILIAEFKRAGLEFDIPARKTIEILELFALGLPWASDRSLEGRNTNERNYEYYG